MKSEETSDTALESSSVSTNSRTYNVVYASSPYEKDSPYEEQRHCSATPDVTAPPAPPAPPRPYYLRSIRMIDTRRPAPRRRPRARRLRAERTKKNMAFKPLLRLIANGWASEMICKNSS
ncbi:hypothetical protein EVAR_37945_1 [Eumeta japonica]|uniref:Uncharacterized protein n=1 Tax=Eumeta variegata TaxID=151549 RepID=A0A4C1XDZ9_EUMVA|nr:hypothetical protein EVAR_37945_1 [Eumeta japonica]